MSYSLVQRVASTGGYASSTTIALAITGVASGSLLVVAAKYEAATGVSFTCADGTHTYIEGTLVEHSGGGLASRMFYVLAATAGDYTVTVTFGSAKAYRAMIIEEYSYTGGTISFDTEPTSGNGTSTALATGNMTTTGTDELVVAGYGLTNGTTSAHLVNSAAADGAYQSAYQIGTFNRAVAATFTGNASCTLDGSNSWCISALAFKITSGPFLRSKSPSSPALSGSLKCKKKKSASPQAPCRIPGASLRASYRSATVMPTSRATPRYMGYLATAQARTPNRSCMFSHRGSVANPAGRRNCN